MVEWKNESETTYYQEAIKFRPNHSVEWQLRVERNTNDGWDWWASLEWPTSAVAEGHESTEDAAKHAAESQIKRWAAWPPSPGKEIQSMGFKPDVFTPPPDPSAEEHVLLGPKSKPKPEPRDLSRREFLDLAAKGQVTDEERLIYLESCYVTDELSRDSRTNLARQIRELKDKIEMGLK